MKAAVFSVLAFSAFVGVSAVPVPAQTATGPGQHSVGTAHTCLSCHGPHRTYGTDANLRVGASAAIAAYSVPGLRDASSSCLRCHATADIREREASAEWGEVRVVEGRFLGLDLSDDHPLGYVKDNVVDRLTLLRPLLEAERAAAGKSEPPVVQCSDCHDPHDRDEGAWNPANDRRCAVCHEERRYRLASHSTLSCANCHELHGGSDQALLAERDGDLLCITCHVTPGRAGGHLDPSRVKPAPPGHILATVERCAGCHPPHGSG